MAKYETDVVKLLELVGGKENINTVAHCATRMRFVLKDDAKADVDAIGQMDAVKGTFTNAGQFQVIIGNDVPTFYREFVANAGITEATKAEVKEAGAQKQNKVQQAVAFLADIFVPLIPGLVAGGLMLGFRNILEAKDLPWLDAGKTYLTLESTKDIATLLHSYTWWVAEAVFAFLPVGVTWSAVRRLGGTPILGILMGLMLVSGSFMNAYDYGNVSTFNDGANLAVIAGPAAVKSAADSVKKEHISNYIEKGKTDKSIHPDVAKEALSETTKTTLAYAFENKLTTGASDIQKLVTLKNAKDDINFFKKFKEQPAAFASRVIDEAYVKVYETKVKAAGTDEVKKEGEAILAQQNAAVSKEYKTQQELADSGAVKPKFQWNFFGLKVNLIGYQALVLPALFVSIALVWLERFMNKVTPDVVKIVVVPFVTLVLTGFLAITIIGPSARFLGDSLAGLFKFLLATPGLNVLGALLFGGSYAPLVITGLHHTFIAVDLQLTASFGGTPIWPMIAMSNISQSMAALAVFFIARRQKERKLEEVSISGAVAAWFGITEPAMFGANLKLSYPFIAAIVASAAGAVILTLGGVLSNGIGVGGLALAWASIKFEGSNQLFWWIATLVTCIVAFGGTLLLSKTGVKLPGKKNK